ncbi:MAG: hypothetical protein ABIH49_00600 [archaeon]
MQQLTQFLIGIFILILGIPIGNLLAKFTREELAQGQKYFKLIILASLLGAIASLFFRNDYLLFTFLFIIIITSRCLKIKKKK